MLRKRRLSFKLRSNGKISQAYFVVTMKTLLVTGASGFLGWNICQRAKSDWTIFETIYSHSANIPGVALVKIDLTIFKDLKKLFRETKPAAVIHTATLSDPNFCQENHDTSYRINTEAAINMARNPHSAQNLDWIGEIYNFREL